ncbi:hypothetical protein BH09PAT2_BH09PAT2_05430 [soil metagenome]
MPHIHEAIDLTIEAFVIHKKKVLLVHHKKLLKWLPPGGHVELDQDPEEALYAELQEETGLTRDQLTIYGNKPTITAPGTKFLYAPTFLDIHDISSTHKHIGMVYFAEAKTDRIVLAEKEHNEIRWFSAEELADPQYEIIPSVQFYAAEAFKIVETNRL